MQPCQNRRMSRGGLKLTGWLSGVAASSWRQNLTVLSPSAVSRRVPVASNAHAQMLASLSSDPGCSTDCAAWKLLPLVQSQNLRRGCCAE